MSNDILAANSRPIGQFRSLTQIILETIRTRIFSGEYAPGDRLNIADLASQFEVSPVPVREALRNLQSEGLADFVANRGFAVSRLSADDARELFLLRFPLEYITAVEASVHATQQDISALKSLLDKMEAAFPSDDWHRMHEEFHRTIGELSKLERFAKLIETYRGKMLPYSRMYLSHSEHVEQAHVEHKLLVDAMEERSAEKILEVMRKHLERPARIAMQTLGVSDPDLKAPF